MGIPHSQGCQELKPILCHIIHSRAKSVLVSRSSRIGRPLSIGSQIVNWETQHHSVYIHACADAHLLPCWPSWEANKALAPATIYHRLQSQDIIQPLKNSRPQSPHAFWASGEGLFLFSRFQSHIGSSETGSQENSLLVSNLSITFSFCLFEYAGKEQVMWAVIVWVNLGPGMYLIRSLVVPRRVLYCGQ